MIIKAEACLADYSKHREGTSTGPLAFYILK